MKRAAALALVAGTASAALAGPLPKAPPATTPPSLPAGVTLTPVMVPTGPAFQPRAARWWKRKKPCPKGGTLETIVADRQTRRYFAKAYVCRDAKGEQHGPGVAVYENEQFYEDSWSEHGLKHGARFTYGRDGKPDHFEIWVEDKLQGPATEWSGDRVLRTGQYKDDKPYGLWEEHYPTGLDLRGYYLDGGDAVGTWIGTRQGVATAIVVEEHSVGGGGVYRIFDAGGELTLERKVGADGGGQATAYRKGVRLAEYDCRAEWAIGESRFYDDAGVLTFRWDSDTRTLTDSRRKKVTITDEQRKQLGGVRDACRGAIWMLEGPPPSRHSAFGLPPPPLRP
jgi:antitoxin component YwqK of YwqJK toxin-antitoxin module